MPANIRCGIFPDGLGELLRKFDMRLGAKVSIFQPNRCNFLIFNGYHEFR